MHEVVVPLALFMALMLALSLYALAASGHFPSEHRTPALRSNAGRVILFGSLALAAICLVAGLTVAWRMIPWPAAVIGGGGMILVAPLVLQRFPDRFVDGRSALVAFAGASALSAMALIWMTF